MLEIEFPSGVLIAAGWVPEGSPQGAYEITVSFGFEMLEKEYFRDFSEARLYIQGLVSQWESQREIPHTVTRSTYLTLPEAPQELIAQ